MKTIDLQQGSAEWHAHRAQHFNASDAPAMMGCSPYMTRTELLHRLHTGLVPEVDAAKQRRFDDGHRFEALARPLAEKIVGEDLYPVTGTEGRLSASFDGLTLMEDTAFEHKSLNDELRACMRDQGNGYDLPLLYRVQMEHQLMVSGAERVLFMASKWDGDELVEERHCWYASDPTLRAQIAAGWKQFEADLAVFTPVEVVDKPVAQAVTALPSVSVQVSGEIAVRDNFPAFEVALRDFIANRLIRKPSTDQDFADLDLQIRALKNAEAALDASEAQTLGQIVSVDTFKRTKDMLHKLARDNRLMAEKLLAARKEEIKAEIVAEGVSKFRQHIAALNERLGKPYMPTIPADFGGAVKNKRTVDSLREAVGNELTRVKIEASAIADRIDANLRHLREKAANHAFLFADTATIVLKATDDLQTLVSSRIAAHEQQEAVRLEAERERIRAEEAVRLQREADEAVRQKAAADEKAQREAKAAVAASAGPAPAPNFDQTYDNGAPMFSKTTFKENGDPIMLDEEGKRSIFCDVDEGFEPEKPTLKLGEINARLDPISVTADGLAKLGFTATVDKGARLYRPSDYPRICEALIQHITEVADTQAA
jgi:putative phage-type endonuclease